LTRERWRSRRRSSTCSQSAAFTETERAAWSEKGRRNPHRRRKPYPAEKARGGEIILNTPLRRWVFIGGLIGAIALVLFMSLMRWAA
jgi:hypothetical protein